MPDTGHCSRAATRASWASSSASPTSPTILARAAISRADSIRQTASIARWVSDVLGLGGRLRPCVRLPEVVRFVNLANFDLTILAGRIGDALGPFHRLFPRLHLPQPEAGDQLFRLGERPVDDGTLGAREFDARALCAPLEPPGDEQHARLHELLVELAHLGEELLVRENAGL